MKITCNARAKNAFRSWLQKLLIIPLKFNAMQREPIYHPGIMVKDEKIWENDLQTNTVSGFSV
jgi:hypothetical protein